MENRIIVLFFMLVALSFVFTGISILLLRLRAKKQLRILPIFWCMLFFVSIVPADIGKSVAELALYTDYTDGLRVEMHLSSEEVRPEHVPDIYLSHNVLRAVRGVTSVILLLWFFAGCASFSFGIASYFDGIQYLTRHSAVCRDKRLNEIYDSAKKKVGIRRNIPLRVMQPDVRISPCTCGIVFPSVYVGGGCHNEFNELWLELIFMHELTHIKHRDTLTKLITLFATSFHALHPISKMIRNAVCEDLEYLCDEAVLKKAGEHLCGEYISMILETAKRNLREDWQGAEILSNLSSDGQAILRRYQNMKNCNGKKYHIRAVTPLVIGMILNMWSMSAIHIRSLDNNGIDMANPILCEAVCRYFGLNDPHDLTEENLLQIYCLEFARPYFPEDRLTYACIINEESLGEALYFTSDVRVMDTRDIVLFGGLRTLIFSDLTESSVTELYESTRFAVIER